mmetsp:Transcript_23735/g.32337  ORF Transcript_23735/g.32337 Transcript_23735/m.32337 type:complete len:130 (-) Transcript_23735:1380-1769(-)
MTSAWFSQGRVPAGSRRSARLRARSEEGAVDPPGGAPGVKIQRSSRVHAQGTLRKTKSKQTLKPRPLGQFIFGTSAQAHPAARSGDASSVRRRPLSPFSAAWLAVPELLPPEDAATASSCSAGASSPAA